MQTPSIGRARQSASARRGPASGASAGTAGFAQHVGLMSRSTIERAPELANAASLTAILGAQEVATDEGAPREAAGRYGTDLLDRLTALRMDVLEGRVSASRLTALAHAIRKDRPPCGDLRVDEILDAIELRVEVEIAKLTEAASASPVKALGPSPIGEQN
jgi:Class II flagellar assembly regulator